MQQRLEELFVVSLNPQLVNQVQAELIELLANPEVFEPLFNIAQNSPNEKSKISALTYIPRAINVQIDAGLTPEIMNSIKSSLIQLAFSPQHQKFIDVIAGIIFVVASHVTMENWSELITATLNAIQNPETVVSAIAILSRIVKLFSSEVKSQSAQKLYEFVVIGTQENSWPIRVASFELLSSISDVLIENQVDLFPQINTFIGYNYSPADFTNPQLKDYLIRIWVVIGEIIGKLKIVQLPENVSGAFETLFNNAIEIARTEQIEAYERSLVIHSLLGLIKILNEEQLGIIFDLEFTLGAIITESGTECSFDFINQALQDLDLETIYTMLKTRTQQAFQTENISLHQYAISVLANALVYAPEVMAGDTEFLVTTLNSAFDSESEPILEAVCKFLDSFNETFPTATIFVSSMLLRLVPLLVHESSDLRTKAYSACHCLCDLLDSDIPEFFTRLWEIKDNIPEDDFDQFAIIFAESIGRTDVGDAELSEVISYIETFFAEDASIYQSVPALFIIGAVLKKDQSPAAQLLPPAMNIVARALKLSNAQCITEAIDFIGFIFPLFSTEIMETYSEVVNAVNSIAQSIIEGDGEEEDAAPEEEEAGEEEDEAANDTVQVAAIGTMCAIAKRLNSAEFAKNMQECIMSGLVNDVSFEHAEDLYMASTDIIKLLDNDDASMLFVNFHETITSDKNPRIVSSALVPYAKLIRNASEELKSKFLNLAFEFITLFFEGQLPCLGGVKPLEGRTDIFLFTNVALVIMAVVRTPNIAQIDNLCQAMLAIIKAPNNLAAYAFVGAYSDCIKFGTCSQAAADALFEIIPELIANADNPDMQQNLCFLLNIVVQKSPSMAQNVLQHYETILEWYNTAMEQGSGCERLLSNIASLFTTLGAFSQEFPDDAVIAALEQFPPYDVKETQVMSQMLLQFLTVRKEFSGEVLGAAILAMARLLLLPDNEIVDTKIKEQTLAQLRQSFVSYTKSLEPIWNYLEETFGKSAAKMEKLRAICGISQ